MNRGRVAHASLEVVNVTEGDETTSAPLLAWYVYRFREGEHRCCFSQVFPRLVHARKSTYRQSNLPAPHVMERRHPQGAYSIHDTPPPHAGVFYILLYLYMCDIVHERCHRSLSRNLCRGLAAPDVSVTLLWRPGYALRIWTPADG